jgi:mono/diheme cytochrome c family protein
MKKNIIFFSLLMLGFSASSLYATTGKKVFETYCWGCHHQTAVAFGPPFEEIASKRSSEEIKAMITDPESVSKVFKYKRNAMPSFQLSDENLTAITKYILSYKPDENRTSDSNATQDNNKGGN